MRKILFNPKIGSSQGTARPLVSRGFNHFVTGTFKTPPSPLRDATLFITSFSLQSTVENANSAVHTDISPRRFFSGSRFRQEGSRAPLNNAIRVCAGVSRRSVQGVGDMERDRGLPDAALNLLTSWRRKLRIILSVVKYERSSVRKSVYYYSTSAGF